MATRPPFILVHGSWHGGWCWDAVAKRLEDAGHPVYAPTLQGLAERAAEATPATGLHVHAREVADLLEANDLHDAILVGHSYGGMVLNEVAEQQADRIARLVYLDGLVPSNGDSCFSLMPGAETGFRQAAESLGGASVPPFLSPEDFGIEDPKEADRVRALLTPMPLATHTEACDAPRNRWKDLPKSYILCTGFGLGDRYHQHAVEAGWDTHVLHMGHDAMLIDPEATARALLACSSAPV